MKRSVSFVFVFVCALAAVAGTRSPQSGPADPAWVAAAAVEQIAHGNAGVAAELLRPLAVSSQDPRYAAALAAALRRAEQPEEARVWLSYASDRYRDLVRRDRGSHARQAALFFAAVGDSPGEAWDLARYDASRSPDTESCELAWTTSSAVGETLRACQIPGCGDHLATVCADTGEAEASQEIGTCPQFTCSRSTAGLRG